MDLVLYAKKIKIEFSIRDTGPRAAVYVKITSVESGRQLAEGWIEFSELRKLAKTIGGL